MILGTGLDLAEIERFHLDAAAQAWFSQRIFTPEEWAYAKRRKRWPQHLAGCFAAKEAFRKALGRAVPWRAVSVTHLTGGAPMLLLAPAIQQLLDERTIIRTHLSITHARDHAAAVVLLEGTCTS